jgi:hypothetical protein
MNVVLNKSKKLMALLLVFSLIFGIFAFIQPAATAIGVGGLSEVYVNHTSAGNDSNSGTSVDDPVKTFARAKELLAPNGTIYFVLTTDFYTTDADETWTFEPEYGTAKISAIIRTTGNKHAIISVKRNTNL